MFLLLRAIKCFTFYSLVVAAVIFPLSASAWNDHFRLTRIALEGIQELRAMKVEVTPFAAVVAALGFKSEAEFHREIQINKKFNYEFKLKEAPGARVSVLDVLSVYADEPDWGMDKELFSEDQFPELWKSEYEMMGGKKGTPSQSFRHMYWVPFRFSHPISTFKLPFNKLFESMGAAPWRAQLFLDLSRKAKKAGHNYWSIRFLASALHYLEDLTQPFHASQVPTKNFILMTLQEDLKLRSMKNFVLEAQHIVTYYHFSFEDYIAEIMAEEGSKTASREFLEFKAALEGRSSSGNELVKFITLEPLSELIIRVSTYSNLRSADAGAASIAFFPPITVPYVGLVPERFIDEKWWKLTNQNGKQDSEIKRQYFTLVEAMFGILGNLVRQVVRVSCEFG